LELGSHVFRNMKFMDITHNNLRWTIALVFHKRRILAIFEIKLDQKLDTLDCCFDLSSNPNVLIMEKSISR